MNGARTLAFGLSRHAVATLQNFRTCGCSRSLARHTNPLGRQALELHTGCRAALARGLDCGVPRYMHQSLFYHSSYRHRKSSVGGHWIDLLSLPIIHISQGQSDYFRCSEKVANTLPYRYQGRNCAALSPSPPQHLPFSWPTIVRCTPLPQDSPRRRVILSSYRPPPSTASVQLPQH